MTPMRKPGGRGEGKNTSHLLKKARERREKNEKKRSEKKKNVGGGEILKD